jgi:hypothetical protein
MLAARSSSHAFIDCLTSGQSCFGEIIRALPRVGIVAIATGKKFPPILVSRRKTAGRPFLMRELHESGHVTPRGSRARPGGGKTFEQPALTPGRRRLW